MLFIIVMIVNVMVDDIVKVSVCGMNVYIVKFINVRVMYEIFSCILVLLKIYVIIENNDFEYVEFFVNFIFGVDF